MEDLTIKEIGKINLGHKNSSWNIQATLKIKRKFIYINRAYFSMTESQAIKRFEKEYNKIKNSSIKPKNNNLLKEPGFKKAFLQAYNQNKGA